MKISGSGSKSVSGSISQRHRSADPDPHQNVLDPQHWITQHRAQGLPRPTVLRSGSRSHEQPAVAISYTALNIWLVGQSPAAAPIGRRCPAGDGGSNS